MILEAIAAAAARAAAAAAGFITPDACRAGEGEAASDEKPPLIAWPLIAWPLIAKALALAIRAAASASTRGSIVGGGATARIWGARPGGSVVTLAGGGTALYFGPSPPPPPPEGKGRARPTPGARQCAFASYAACV